MRWPKRIYKRRKVWHWLGDAGAPAWLWTRFVRSTWRRCDVCGVRGVGRSKQASSHGGGQPSRYFCSTAHYYEREAW